MCQELLHVVAISIHLHPHIDPSQKESQREFGARRLFVLEGVCNAQVYAVKKKSPPGAALLAIFRVLGPQFRAKRSQKPPWVEENHLIVYL